MYSREELAFQKRYAFATLIRNGITTALPIASLFYRAWGETLDEFAAAADAAAELGLRVYLGPAYRTGNTYVRDDGAIDCHFDEERGLRGLDEAIRFCRSVRGARRRPDPHHAGAGPASRPARRSCCAAPPRPARDLAVPVRLHSLPVEDRIRHGRCACTA